MQINFCTHNVVHFREKVHFAEIFWINQDYSIIYFILQQKKILQRITTKVLRVLDSQHPTIFSQLDTHVDPQNMFNCESHKTVMLKKIVSSYISIRLKHYCKEYNENFLDKKFKRIALKTIHFQGQWFVHSVIVRTYIMKK